MQAFFYLFYKILSSFFVVLSSNVSLSERFSAVGEILMLTEGSLAPVSCLTPNATPCSRMANCRTYEMWKGLNDLISNYFGNITLADLARSDQAGNDYVI